MRPTRLQSLPRPHAAVVIVLAGIAAVAMGEQLQVDGISLLYPPAVVVSVVAAMRGWRSALLAVLAVLAAAVVVDLSTTDPVRVLAIRTPGLLAHWAAAAWMRRRPFGGHSMASIGRLWTGWALGAMGAATITMAVAVGLGSVAPASAIAPWQRLLLTHLTAMFTLGPVVLALGGGPARANRRPGAWMAAAAGAVAAAAGQLSLAGVAPPIMLVFLGLIPATMRRVSDLQAGTVAAGAAALTVIVGLLPQLALDDVQLAQAGLVAASVMSGSAHAQSRSRSRQRRELLRREVRLRAVVGAVDEGIAVVGPRRQFLLANAEAAAILRRRPDELVGELPEVGGVTWVDRDGQPIPLDDLPSSMGLRGETVTDRDVGARHPDGTVVWCRASTRLVDETGEDPAVVITLRDISDEVEATRQLEAEAAVLRHQALHDPLTGLANRQHLLAELERAQAQARLAATAVGLCYIDLDGFKDVNDRLGHIAGDEVLVQVGMRLRATARGTDMVTRLGGDEFVVLCRDLPRDRVTPDMDALAERITACLGEEILTSAGPVSIGASCGWSLVAADDLMAAAALGRADERMMANKRHRRHVRPGPVPAPHQPAQHPRPVGAPLQVYIVDDNPAMRLLAQRVVESDDVVVIGQAGDGRTAVAEILARQPDVVLCDVMMPDLDGPGVVRLVREVNPGQAFVFWSAMGRSATSAERVQLGIPHVTKDRTEELPSVVRQLAGRT